MSDEIKITKELCLQKLQWIGILHVATVDTDNHPQVRCVSAIHFEPDAIFFTRRVARVLPISLRRMGLSRWKDLRNTRK